MKKIKNLFLTTLVSMVPCCACTTLSGCITRGLGTTVTWVRTVQEPYFEQSYKPSELTSISIDDTLYTYCNQSNCKFMWCEDVLNHLSYQFYTGRADEISVRFRVNARSIKQQNDDIVCSFNFSIYKIYDKSKWFEFEVKQLPYSSSFDDLQNHYFTPKYITVGSGLDDIHIDDTFWQNRNFSITVNEWTEKHICRKHCYDINTGTDVEEASEFQNRFVKYLVFSPHFYVNTEITN